MSRIALCTALIACLGMLACSTETSTGPGGTGPAVTADTSGTDTPGTLPDGASAGSRTFSLPGDPCMLCVLNETTGQPDCAPAEANAACASDDCCMSAAVCQPCAAGDTKCPASGLQCRGEAAISCEDEDPCTEDLTFCLKEEGKCECRSAPAPDGTPCKQDANTCTSGDTCQLGKCVAGEPADLSSENPCVELVCVKGKIEEKLLGGPCTDGDPCTFGDRCTLGQCVPEGLIECPADPCASQTYCDKNQGKCVSEPMPDGTECNLDDPCITRARCQSGVCVIEEGVRCDDEQPCTTDKCNPETKECSHEPLPDGTPCGDAGTCENGLCTENLPPSAPEVKIVPDRPQPRDGLTCAVTRPSQDPEGEEVTYSFAWLRDGVPAQEHTGQDIPEGTTLECEVWTCTVTPEAGGYPGHAGTDYVRVSKEDQPEPGPPIGHHSYPPQGGSFSRFMQGEAFASKIRIDPSRLPMSIGRMRGVLGAGYMWTPGLWADAGGQPGGRVATGSPVLGQGATLQDAELSVPYQVTGGSIWAGFEAASGSMLAPAGPIPYDNDGRSTQNHIYGLHGFNFSWQPATTHEPSINDWIVEIAEPDLDACPPLP